MDTNFVRAPLIRATVHYKGPSSTDWVPLRDGHQVVAVHENIEAVLDAIEEAEGKVITSSQDIATIRRWIVTFLYNIETVPFLTPAEIHEAIILPSTGNQYLIVGTWASEEAERWWITSQTILAFLPIGQEFILDDGDTIMRKVSEEGDVQFVRSLRERGEPVGGYPSVLNSSLRVYVP